MRARAPGCRARRRARRSRAAVVRDASLPPPARQISKCSSSPFVDAKRDGVDELHAERAARLATARRAVRGGRDRVEAEVAVDAVRFPVARVAAVDERPRNGDSAPTRSRRSAPLGHRRRSQCRRWGATWRNFTMSLEVLRNAREASLRAYFTEPGGSE